MAMPNIVTIQLSDSTTLFSEFREAYYWEAPNLAG